MSSNIDAGYNLEAAQQLIISALGIGAEIVEDIDELDSNYIAKIAQNWYTPEGYDYFNNKFKPTMDGIYSDLAEQFYSYIVKIKEAIRSWEQRTGGDYSNTNTVKAEKPKCDVSAIKDQRDDGTRGIDVQEVESLNTVLDNCFEALMTSIGKLKDQVKGTEFIGGNQIEELTNGFKEIENKINNLLETTKSDIDDRIIKSLATYSNLGSNTSNKFSLDSKNVDFSRITNNAADSLNGKFWSEDNIQKQYWTNSSSGKLDYEIREDGSVLITKDGIPMGYTDKKGLIAAMSDTSQSSSSSNNSAGTHDNGNASEFGGEGEIPSKEGHQSSVNNNNTTNNSGSRTTHARGGEGQYRGNYWNNRSNNNSNNNSVKTNNNDFDSKIISTDYVNSTNRVEQIWQNSKTGEVTKKIYTFDQTPPDADSKIISTNYNGFTGSVEQTWQNSKTGEVTTRTYDLSQMTPEVEN